MTWDAYRQAWWLAVLCVACGRPQGSHPRLPGAFDANREAVDAVVMELPDTGGWLADGLPVDSSRITPILTEFFAARDAQHRAIFVWYNPRRAWADYVVIANAARAAGGSAYDAELSGITRDAGGSQTIRVQTTRAPRR